MGDPNASIPTPQPVHYRPMFGGIGRGAANSALTFVSAAFVDAAGPQRLGLTRSAVAVRQTRSIGKSDMVLNSATPHIEVDAETYEVHADGVLLTCEPPKLRPWP